MKNILIQIINKKREDLFRQKKLLPVQELKKQIKIHSDPDFFYKSVIYSINNPAVIAEVKFRSPSSGKIGSPQDLINKVRQYETAGADGISVITERHFFDGNIDFVKDVKGITKLPVLQKDFIVDEYQI